MNLVHTSIYDVDDESAREFLTRNRKWIEEAMCRAGNEAIELFANEDGLDRLYDEDEEDEEGEEDDDA